MAHLTAGTGLAFRKGGRRRVRGKLSQQPTSARQIGHEGALWALDDERPAQSPGMIIELADEAGVQRPMAGIVTRREIVDEGPGLSPSRRTFDRDDTCPSASATCRPMLFLEKRLRDAAGR